MKCAALTKPITRPGRFMGRIPYSQRVGYITICPDGMRPMNIAEKPIAVIQGRRISTGDGIHMIAVEYPRGTRLDTHMHREAQLVYATRGTMQVTTPKGRWLVPPDRAVWVPARSEHAIDVLADIEMRTLYFDPTWLARERRDVRLDAEFVVRVTPLLHETILALFDG